MALQKHRFPVFIVGNFWGSCNLLESYHGLDIVTFFVEGLLEEPTDFGDWLWSESLPSICSSSSSELTAFLLLLSANVVAALILMLMDLKALEVALEPAFVPLFCLTGENTVSW